MKTRNGWVSNSSSSSFIIRKDNISQKQLEFLTDPRGQVDDTIRRSLLANKFDPNISSIEDEIAKIKEDFGFCELVSELWEVEEEDDYYRFSTYMDNLNLIALASYIGLIPEEIDED